MFWKLPPTVELSPPHRGALLLINTSWLTMQFCWKVQEHYQAESERCICYQWLKTMSPFASEKYGRGSCWLFMGAHLLQLIFATRNSGAVSKLKYWNQWSRNSEYLEKRRKSCRNQWLHLVPGEQIKMFVLQQFIMSELHRRLSELRADIYCTMS